MLEAHLAQSIWVNDSSKNQTYPLPIRDLTSTAKIIPQLKLDISLVFQGSQTIPDWLDP